MADLVDNSQRRFNQRLATLEKALSPTVTALIDIYSVLIVLRGYTPGGVRDESIGKTMEGLASQLETLIAALKELRVENEP